MTFPPKEYLVKLAAVNRGNVIKGTCLGCKEPGRERVDGGLLCGCWCDRCFERSVRSCRSKS